MFFETSVFGGGSFLFYLLQFPTVLSLAYCTCEFSFSMAVAAGLKKPKYFRPVMGVLTVVWVAALAHTVSLGGDIFGIRYTLLLVLPIGLIIFDLVFLGRAVSALSEKPLYRISAAYRALSQGSSSAMAVFGMYTALLFCVIGAFVLLVMREATFQQEYLYVTFVVINTVIIGIMVLTHLNYVEERLEISTKITGILLVLILGGSTVMMSSLFEENTVLSPRQEQLLANQGLAFSARGDSLYEIKLVPANWDQTPPIKLEASQNKPAIIRLPFAFPFYGKTYQQMALYPAGYAVPYDGVSQVTAGRDKLEPKNNCFGAYPAIVPFCSGLAEFDVFLRVSDERVVVTWRDQRSGGNIIFGGTSQLELKPDGGITFSYRDFPELGTTFWYSVIGMTSGAEPLDNPSLFRDIPRAYSSQSIWFDLALELRLLIHKKSWLIGVFLVTLVALMIGIFRPYLDRVLVAPLNHILSGLQKVDEGRLDVKLNDRTKDEFGDLSRGFNKMIRSLEEVRQRGDEQTELLETELTYRTIEVANRGDEEILSKDAVFEQRIREVIEANMTNFDFQVGELADEMAVSIRQLHRRAVTLTAKTPAALIRTIRLERARQLLLAQAANVSEAAHQTGFKDVGYFSKLFIKQFKVQPSDLIER